MVCTGLYSLSAVLLKFALFGYDLRPVARPHWFVVMDFAHLCPHLRLLSKALLLVKKTRAQALDTSNIK